MSTGVLAFCIALPVVSLALAVGIVLTERATRRVPKPQPVDAYDVDAIHRAALQARYPNTPPSEGEQS